MKTSSYLYLLLLNALVSSLLITFELTASPIHFVFSLMLFGMALVINSKNMIFFIRTFFLAIVGFIAVASKLISENGLFGFHMPGSQTLEIASLMFLLTNIALFSSQLGLVYGSRIKQRPPKNIHYENRWYFYLVLILVLITGIAIIASHGSMVSSGAGYGRDTSKVALPLSNLNVTANILFYILILLYFKFKNIYGAVPKNFFYMILFTGIYLFLFAEFLRGVRMDALNGVFGVIILYLVYSNKSLKITPKMFFLGLTLFILMQAMGILRSSFNSMDFNQMINAISLGFSRMFGSSDLDMMFYQGTINDIASTFSGTIMLLQSNIIDFYYGSSYVDYILRTPPKILYPGRPDDLAWIFKFNGFSSGGGFFELAEAYLNFGIYGAYIVPFTISCLISYSFRRFTLNRYSIFHSILLFSLLSGFMRGLLYQTFTFYKAVVTGLVLYFILLCFLKLTSKFTFRPNIK